MSAMVATQSAPSWPPHALERVGAAGLDVNHMVTADVPPRDFIFGQWAFFAGEVGLFYAPGDSGKSYVSMACAISVALAGVAAYDPLGVRAAATSGGNRVLYLSAEDSPKEIHRRVHRIADALGAAGRIALRDHFAIKSFRGVTPPPDVQDPVFQAAAKADGAGCRLIVFDTLTRFHSADENDNVEMAKVINAFESIAQATGAALLILHHCSKASQGKDGDATAGIALRGASSIRDNTRWNLALAAGPGGSRVLRETKHNGGRGSDDVYIRWTDESAEGPFVRCEKPASAAEIVTQVIDRFGNKNRGNASNENW